MPKRHGLVFTPLYCTVGGDAIDHEGTAVLVDGSSAISMARGGRMEAVRADANVERNPSRESASVSDKANS